MAHYNDLVWWYARMRSRILSKCHFDNWAIQYN